MTSNDSRLLIESNAVPPPPPPPPSHDPAWRFKGADPSRSQYDQGFDDGAMAAHLECESEKRALDERVATLEAALKKYGDHETYCYDQMPDNDGRCVCGFRDVFEFCSCPCMACSRSDSRYHGNEHPAGHEEVQP